MFYEILPTRQFHTNSGPLTYSSDLPLKPGHLVQIPLGRQITTGIVLKKVPPVDFKTKPVTSLLYDIPLPTHLIKTLPWLADYYLNPLPLVANLLIPNGITKTRRKKPEENHCPKTHSSETIPLNPAQRQVLQSLKNTTTTTKLLHGITGSGKTNIYLTLAKETFIKNQSTILLVPEISLTPQLIQIFEQHFPGAVITLHSNQTEAERHLAWEQILTKTSQQPTATPLVIIGPRSALFAPVQNLGLILIDEAHDSSFYQDTNPRYSAIRLASTIAKNQNIPCILGTATPNLVDYHLAKSKNALIPLTEKAKSTAITPKITLVDLKNPENFTKNRYFSNDLIKTIETNLKNHHQTLIFHNRRGSAPLTLCQKCGWQALCPNCYLPLTLHTDSYSLRCHTCGHEQPVPSSCPTCHHPDIRHKGFGTKLLESELKKLFKDAKIARFDGDNQKHDTLEQRYNEVKSGEIDIIIGTQTLARGLDLPRLASVGIVQADAGLSLPDFAAEEHTFELLTQVIGRVGRGHLDNPSVIIQTFQPTSPVITTAITADYDNFATYLLKKRRAGHFPPYTFLAKITITYKTETTTLKYIKNLEKILKKDPALLVSPPTPAFHEHTARGYTWQITLRSTSRKKLLETLKNLPPSTNQRIALDPPSLL